LTGETALYVNRNEDHLRHAFDSISKMHSLCDQITASPHGYPTTREDEVEGIRAMMRKIQRDTLAFHAAHPEYLALPKPQCEDNAALTILARTSQKRPRNSRRQGIIKRTMAPTPESLFLRHF